jgi:hypothetical protein
MPWNDRARFSLSEMPASLAKLAAEKFLQGLVLGASGDPEGILIRVS